MVDWNEVLTTIVGGLGVSALLAILTWLAGRLTPTGRAFWRGLGSAPSRVTFFMAIFAVTMSVIGVILPTAPTGPATWPVVEDEIFTTPPFPAAREAGSPNYQTSPSCPPDYEVTGYYCEVTNGTGSLANIGLASSTTAHCLWTNVPENSSFTAFGLAICKRTPRPLSQ